jgi:photosystem II stability/assembly factor-like uncharacterized protein
MIHVTRDGGKQWQDVTPKDLPPFTRISLIEASPHDAGVAYVAGNRYQLSDRRPFVYKTHDYGRTWTTIVGGLADENIARAIREDKQRKGLLFLGTDSGIFVSFDDGGAWQSLQLDLPVTPVHGIEVRDNDVLIGTHGRSFYSLDEIGVLRQASHETTSEPVVLFRPSDATRSISRGVAVDYYLKQAADKVTIEILDGKGTVINTFTGTPTPEGGGREGGPGGRGGAPAPEQEEEGGGRGNTPPKVAVKTGLNRFTWDMRYPGAKDFPGLIMWAGSVRGPLAPPAAYQVRLTVAGASKTQPFAITRNQAIAGVTDADLQQQFTLAKAINDKVSEANTAVIRIRQLKTQIADRLAKSTDAGLKASGQALTDKLTDVEGEIYQYRNRSNQDPLNYPIRLNNKLAALQGIVESAAYKPTDQSQAVFKDLSSRLDQQLARLNGLVETDLVELNRQLASQKLDAVEDK